MIQEAAFPKSYTLARSRPIRHALERHWQFGCRLSDLRSTLPSLTFYVDGLGFQLVESQPDADRAVVLDPYGEPILLAGPAVADVSAHLNEPRIVYQPGATLDFAQENLDARFAALAERGLIAIQQGQTVQGDRQLSIKDPSNYTILFVQQPLPRKRERCISGEETT